MVYCAMDNVLYIQVLSLILENPGSLLLFYLGCFTGKNYRIASVDLTQIMYQQHFYNTIDIDVIVCKALEHKRRNAHMPTIDNAQAC